MQQLCPKNTADSLIERIEELHSAPQIAQKILRITRQPDFNMNELVKCLEHDPALVARVLRVVNSARYGLRHGVTSVRRAATYLGPRSIRLITLTFGLIESLTKGVPGKLYSEYWRRALTMAVVAARLTPTDDNRMKDEAYSCGLLADLGILILAQFHGEDYAEMYYSVPHGPKLQNREREVFGCDHATLGSRLLALWELPDPLVCAVANHHKTPGEREGLELAVHIGDLMSDAIWTSDSPSLATAKILLEKRFGLDTDGFIDLALGCRPEITEEAAEFGVKLEGEISCEKLVEEARKRYADTSLEIALEMDSIMAVVEDGKA